MTLDLRPSRRILLGSAFALATVKAHAATDHRHVYDAQGQVIWTGLYGGEGAAYVYDKAGNRSFVRSGPYILGAQFLRAALTPTTIACSIPT